MKYLIKVKVVDHRDSSEGELEFWGRHRSACEGKITRWSRNPRNKHYEIQQKSYEGLTPKDGIES